MVSAVAGPVVELRASLKNELQGVGPERSGCGSSRLDRHGNLRSAGWLRPWRWCHPCSSRALLKNVARRSPVLARCGTATKCGCSPPAARSISRFPHFRQRHQRLLSATDDRALAADPTAPHPWNSATTSRARCGFRCGILCFAFRHLWRDLCIAGPGGSLVSFEQR